MQQLPAVSPRKLLCRVFGSHWTFAVLQVLDLLTTIAVFRFGGFEANPLVARFSEHFGRFPGLLLSKLIAIALALGVRRLVWVINFFYLGIVCWNILVLLLLSIAH